MKKIIILLITIVVVLTLTNIITVSFLFNDKETKDSKEGKFSGLELTLEELEKDLDFYKNLDIYFKLLDYEDSEYMGKIEERLDEKIEDDFMLFAVSRIIEDERSKEIINKLKDEVYSKKLTEEEKEEIFSKNNACAELATGINEQLKNKFESSYNISKEEELEFIFYSPSLKSCLYSTAYEYSSTVDDYYNKHTKIVYNASTQSKIDEFTVYAYNYDYLDDEDIEKDRKRYVKFILENSGYNADLLKDISYIY
ncbi:hypothetical protein AMJ47_02955 [Parcubacteria bacterium DG_72]|nr:MAG: hypothetical protein AMJ47_02955 [Parcubacteria bacterium DG_72]